MSLNSLASSRVAREASSRVTVPAGASDDAVPTTPNAPDVQNALSALVEYLPAETVTLYIAAIGALPAARQAVPRLSAWMIYWAFALLTPLLFSLIYAGKRRAAGQPRSPGVKEWPWWPMVAATIAFLAWGLAVPDAPYFDSDGGRVIAGVIAIFISTLLGVFGRFFSPGPQEP